MGQGDIDSDTGCSSIVLDVFYRALFVPQSVNIAHGFPANATAYVFVFGPRGPDIHWYRSSCALPRGRETPMLGLCPDECSGPSCRSRARCCAPLSTAQVLRHPILMGLWVLLLWAVTSSVPPGKFILNCTASLCSFLISCRFMRPRAVFYRGFYGAGLPVIRTSVDSRWVSRADLASVTRAGTRGSFSPCIVFSQGVAFVFSLPAQYLALAPLGSSLIALKPRALTRSLPYSPEIREPGTRLLTPSRAALPRHPPVFLPQPASEDRQRPCGARCQGFPPTCTGVTLDSSALVFSRASVCETRPGCSFSWDPCPLPGPVALILCSGFQL